MSARVEQDIITMDEKKREKKNAASISNECFFLTPTKQQQQRDEPFGFIITRNKKKSIY